MGRADSRSRDLDGACFKAVRFHVSENSGESQFCACKAWDILDEKEPGAGSAGEVAEVRPEVALVLVALAPAGDAPRLAGDAAGKEVDPAKGSEIVVAKGAEVRSNRDIWPVDGQLGAASLVAFDKADDAAAGKLEAEGQSADAGADVDSTDHRPAARHEDAPVFPPFAAFMTTPRLSLTALTLSGRTGAVTAADRVLGSRNRGAGNSTWRATPCPAGAQVRWTPPTQRRSRWREKGRAP